MSVPSSSPPPLASWRRTGVGVLRIAFGVIWAIDAWFKWQPDFIRDFMSYLTETAEGQPPVVRAWIDFWMNGIHVNAQVFAYLTAIAETALAVGLILGVLSNLTYVIGILLSLVIWTTAEGFGGPYVPGSTDIGAAVIYVLVFVGLFFSSAGNYLGLDRYLTPRMGRWRFLASG